MIRQLDNRIVYTYILDSIHNSIFVSICDPVNSYTSVTVSVYSPLFASSNSIRSSIQTKLEHFCPYIG